MCEGIGSHRPRRNTHRGSLLGTFPPVPRLVTLGRKTARHSPPPSTPLKLSAAMTRLTARTGIARHLPAATHMRERGGFTTEYTVHTSNLQRLRDRNVNVNGALLHGECGSTSIGTRSGKGVLQLEVLAYVHTCVRYVQPVMGCHNATLPRYRRLLVANRRREVDSDAGGPLFSTHPALGARLASGPG